MPQTVRSRDLSLLLGGCVCPRGPVDSSRSQHRRTPEIFQKKGRASFRITPGPPAQSIAAEPAKRISSNGCELGPGAIGALMNRVHQPRTLLVLGHNTGMGSAAGADELVEIPYR